MAMTPVPADDDRFRALFDANFAELWRFARRRCANAADADDVTAQVYAVAWRRRSDLPEGDDQRLWLFGVARRVLANQRRTGARRDRLLRRLAAVTDPHDDGEPEPPHDELHAALRALEDDDREVVMMRCWDGLGVGEIAAVLGCTPNAVSIRLHRARRRLADRLAANVSPVPQKEHSHDRS
jgi:RNA polymerase sigma-70 factor, ECF subfamily